MAVVMREKRRYDDLIKSERDEDEDCVGSFIDKVQNRSGPPSSNGSPKIQMEQEKRLRREIANSNERRRMQSINAGFQSLRGLLPHHEGEKLSKAAILQQTAEYIYQLEQDKTKLLNQNAQLKNRLGSQNGTSGVVGVDGVYSSPHSPAVDIPPTIVKRRKTTDGAVESADEGIGNMSPDHSEDSTSEVNELKRQTVDLRIQLERERRHRIGLEEHINHLQQQQQPQIYPRKFERQTVEEVESFQQRVPTPPGRDEIPRYESCYTIRNNLETIVEAIRHLEGDHLFSDDRNNSSSTPPSVSPRPMEHMEICSESAGSSPSQNMLDIPLALTSSPSHPMGQQQQLHHHLLLPLPPTGNSTFPVSNQVSTTVTSLKHHVLNRIANSRSSENEVAETDQPINLEFRPVLSRSPSPQFQQQQQQSLPIQFHIQQQLRPGVIVVKHS